MGFAAYLAYCPLTEFGLDKVKTAARRQAWYAEDDDVLLNPFAKIRPRTKFEFDEEYGAVSHSQSESANFVPRSSYSRVQPIQRSWTDRQEGDLRISIPLETDKDRGTSSPGQIKNELSARLSVTELDPSPQAQEGAAHHLLRGKIIISDQTQLRITLPYGGQA